jgi:SAM-dependent methyltransferase
MTDQPQSDEFALCPLCDADNSGTTPSPFSKPPWVIVECHACEFVYLANPPTYERLEEEFAWEKTSATVTAEKKQAAPVRVIASEAGKSLRRDFFKRNKIRNLAVATMPYPPATLVDIGCGTGRAVANLAQELIAAGHQPKPVGIEISAELAKSAGRKLKKLKGKCLHTDALSGLKQIPESSTSLIVMSSYLEHESSPAEVLVESARCLQSGGVIIIKVPNYACWNRRIVGAKWCGFRYPDHVNYFTPKSLQQMAEKAGLKIKRSSWLDTFPTSDNMYLVVEKP